MMNIGFLPIKHCRRCGAWYVRWESREDFHDGLIITVRTPLISRGFCYPCFTGENLKLDMDIARAERGEVR